MREALLQTYIIALPILLSYIVWILKRQKKGQGRKPKRNDASFEGAAD